LLGHKLGETNHVDLDHPRSTHRARCRLARLATTLFDPPHPCATYAERVGDLLGLHPTVKRTEQAISQLL